MPYKDKAKKRAATRRAVAKWRALHPETDADMEVKFRNKSVLRRFRERVLLGIGFEFDSVISEQMLRDPMYKFQIHEHTSRELLKESLPIW
jgi:hypothetical protein